MSMRPFFTIWIGQALSLIGSQAVQFALVWWLTVETGSATVLATATIVAFVPQIALGPVIGTLVDRWNRKWIMLLADGGIAAVSGVAALIYLSGDPRPWQIFVLLFVRSLGGAFHQPAMQASTTLLVPKEKLTQIQGLNQMMQGGLLIVAAPLGALLVATLSTSAILAVDVVTAIIAIVPLACIAVPQPDASGAEQTQDSSLWSELRQGLDFLRTQPGHLTLLAMATLINLFLVPAFALLPLLVLEHGAGAMQLGGMTSMFGLGSVVGGIALGVLGGFERRIVTTLLGLVALGMATAALALAPSMLWMMLAIAAVGLAVPWANGPIQAILQATVPPQLQGRIFTLYGTLAGMMAPVGLLVAAPVAELAGVRVWYVVGALICVGMGSFGFLLPALFKLEGSTDRELVAVEPT
jgi:DHA3 family macrolide efflux protein-like MFS transporter